jgi:hypothetical protein
VAGVIAGKLPGAVVGDSDEDLVVSDGGVQPQGAGRCAPGKGVFNGVEEGFVYRQSEVLSGVIVNDSVGPAAEGST